MSVQFVINAKLLKTIVKAVENINEECIWTFDSSGLLIRMSDVYRHKMIEMFIAAEDFDSYTCTGAYDLGIVIDRIKDVSKTLAIKDTLRFNYDDTSAQVRLDSNGLSRMVKLIDIKMVGLVPYLNLDFDYVVGFDSKALRNFLRASSKCVDFNVVVEPTKFMVRSETDEGVAEASWDVVVESPSITNYSTDAMSKATATMSGPINVRGSQDGVLEVGWNISKNTTIKALIAPRI